MQDKLKELEKKYSVDWREYEIGELFEITPTKSYGMTNDELRKHIGETLVVSNTSYSNGTFMRSSLKPTEVANQITFSDTTTDEGVFFQPYEFIGYSHVQKMVPKFNEKMTVKIGQYFVSTIRATVRGKYNYGTKLNRTNMAREKITLPTVNNGIAFSYIEEFIATLEAERLATLEAERLATLEAYLLATGLKNIELTPEERSALDKLGGAGSVSYMSVKFDVLFNHIQQGKRLKKSDQLDGDIPFVMAGTTNTGIVKYISNPVRSFPKNSLTIDIFGNTFYRDYEFGAGDDTGVFWNDNNKFSKNQMLFLSTVINVFLAGKYDFGYKLRASQTSNFEVSLPMGTDGNIDYDFISSLMSAMQKVVIKNVVTYLDKRIDTTSKIISKV